MSELYGPALRHTIRTLRRDHPGMWRWLDSTSTAEREVVARWQASGEVSAYLATVKGRRHHKALRKLLSDARAYLEAQDGAVRERWHEVTSSAPWAELPASARMLYEVLTMKALEEGRRGGPNVAMAYHLAIALIEARFGVTYDLSSVRYARDVLVKAGILTFTPGQKWQAGRASRATVWHLCNMPASAREGILHSGSESPAPQMDGRLRHVMEATISRLRDARQRDRAQWITGVAGTPAHGWDVLPPGEVFALLAA